MHRLLKLILIPGLLLSLSACRTNTPSEPEPSPLTGVYQLVELVDASGQNSEALIEHLREQGQEAVLTLNEDGSGTLTLFTTERSVTWTETELVIDGEPMDLSYDQGTITLFGKDNTGKMVFHPLN